MCPTQATKIESLGRQYGATEQIVSDDLKFCEVMHLAIALHTLQDYSCHKKDGVLTLPQALETIYKMLWRYTYKGRVLIYLRTDTPALGPS